MHPTGTGTSGSVSGGVSGSIGVSPGSGAVGGGVDSGGALAKLEPAGGKATMSTAPTTIAIAEPTRGRRRALIIFRTHASVSARTWAILDTMGYNPYRKFKAGPGDYAMVAAVVLVGAALLAWGFFA